jgi:hypothetical protein
MPSLLVTFIKFHFMCKHQLSLSSIEKNTQLFTDNIGRPQPITGHQAPGNSVAV